MLVCKKIGTSEAGLGSQAAAEAPGAAGLSAGRGLWQRWAEGLGGGDDVVQEWSLKSPFLASLPMGLSLPFNHFTCTGWQTPSHRVCSI